MCNKSFKYIYKFFLDKKFLIFILIGIFNTFNGTLLSYALSTKLNANISFVFGYLISLLIAYILNCIINFKEKITSIGFFKFVVSYIPNFLIQNIIVIFAYNVAGVSNYIAYMLAAVIGVPITYVILKLFVFKEAEKKIDNKNLIKNICNSNLRIYMSAILFFTVLIFTANWSLILQENLMKWDIWDAHYPAQVIVSDAIKAKTFPIWNPLMRCGTPYYAILGMPVWYPITLLLDLVGYNPFMPGIEYTLHQIIAGIGAFLLVGKEINNNKKWTVDTFLISLMMGTVYSLSGLFLSNAQHIMIIITAAWAPWGLFFARSFMEEGSIMSLFATSFCISMMILGGYPEMLYNFVLVLFPYMVWFCCKGKEKDVFWKKFFKSLRRYCLVLVLTFIAAGITAIPFLNAMDDITRNTNIGQVPMGFDPLTLFSMFTPIKNSNVGDVSMSNFYMGIIAIISVPAILKNKFRNKALYLIIVIISLLMCFGGETFLHPLFYRFFPMYTVFRFPTLSRFILVLFIILLVGNILKDNFIQNDIGSQNFKLVRYLLFLSMTLSLIYALVLNDFATNEGNVNLISKSLLQISIVLGMYFLLFKLYNNKQMSEKIVKVLMLLIVCVDLVVNAYYYFPITVASFKPNEYIYNETVKNYIDGEMYAFENRNKSVDFTKSQRTISGLNSKSIALNKSFDEEGYLSFLLQDITEYKNTYNYSILQKNPLVYFTNDIVNISDIDYNTWVNLTLPESQIYIDKNIDKFENNIEYRVVSNIISIETLPLTIGQNQIVVNGSFGYGQKIVPRIRVYIDYKYSGNIVPFGTQFCDENGIDPCAGEFEIITENGEKYIEISLPKTNKIYKEIRINNNPECDIYKVAYVQYARDGYDENVKINKFGFNEIDISVNARTKGCLVLLQANYDGWDVYVDGKKSEITEVNNCFMGVILEQGIHQVEMKFRPFDLIIGIILTFSFYIMWIVVIIYLLVKKITNR